MLALHRPPLRTPDSSGRVVCPLVDAPVDYERCLSCDFLREVSTALDGSLVALRCAGKSGFAAAG